MRERAKRRAVCHAHCRQLDIRRSHFAHKALWLFLLAALTGLTAFISCFTVFSGYTPVISLVMPADAEAAIFLLQSSPLPPPVIFSFSLSPSLPPSPWIPQPHHNTVKRRALTDLPPPSFHWPPARQPRFNAVFSLAGSGQVNLRARCDLMPPAFEVSYSSVAHRTQKRCRVAVVKPHP